ncbi:MAG: restriction endonuclease subunit S [Oligoflexus sp.]|nr:restriction endonuclease subunit S [Pseudopedobacter sp.]
MKSNYSELGKYIREVNERNSDLLITNLLGVSMEKTFIPSVANLNGVDLSIYKVLRKEQLACKLMSVGRDEKLPVDLYNDEKPAIISSAYYVFEPSDKNELLPEYLMMWLCRPENDRYIGYISGGDVRGGISWETFCRTPIKVPSIEKQKEIVKEYQVIQNRIAINQQLIQKLEETAQAIYKEWFMDFEFPDENGRPYKSNGGEMVWCEELEKEIPEGWEVKPFTKIIKLSGGGTPDTNKEKYWDGNIPFFTPADVVSSYYSIQTEKNISELGLKNSSTKLYPFNTVFVTARGTVGAISIAGCEMSMNQSCYAITGMNGMNQYFAHQITLSAIEKLKNEAVGAVFAALVTKDFESQILIEPDEQSVKVFGLKIKPIYDYILNTVVLNQKLTELKDLLLSKLATIKD